MDEVSKFKLNPSSVSLHFASSVWLTPSPKEKAFCKCEPKPSPMESMLKATVEFASQTSRGPLAVDEVSKFKPNASSVSLHFASSVWLTPSPKEKALVRSTSFALASYPPLLSQARIKFHCKLR